MAAVPFHDGPGLSVAKLHEAKKLVRQLVQVGRAISALVNVDGCSSRPYDTYPPQATMQTHSVGGDWQKCRPKDWNPSLVNDPPSMPHLNGTEFPSTARLYPPHPPPPSLAWPIPAAAGAGWSTTQAEMSLDRAQRQVHQSRTAAWVCQESDTQRLWPSEIVSHYVPAGPRTENHLDLRRTQPTSAPPHNDNQNVTRYADAGPSCLASPNLNDNHPATTRRPSAQTVALTSSCEDLPEAEAQRWRLHWRIREVARARKVLHLPSQTDQGVWRVTCQRAPPSLDSCDLDLTLKCHDRRCQDERFWKLKEFTAHQQQVHGSRCGTANMKIAEALQRFGRQVQSSMGPEDRTRSLCDPPVLTGHFVTLRPPLPRLRTDLNPTSSHIVTDVCSRKRGLEEGNDVVPRAKIIRARNGQMEEENEVGDEETKKEGRDDEQKDGKERHFKEEMQQQEQQAAQEQQERQEQKVQEEQQDQKVQEEEDKCSPNEFRSSLVECHRIEEITSADATPPPADFALGSPITCILEQHTIDDHDEGDYISPLLLDDEPDLP